MVEPVHKGFCGLLRQVDVAAYIRVDKAELTGFTFRNLIPVFIQKKNGGVHLGLSNGANLIRPVDEEDAYGKAALARGVDVDQIQIFVVEIVGRLTSHKEHTEKRPGVVPQLPDIGGGKKCDGDALRQEELGQCSRVFNGIVGHYIVSAAKHIQPA